MDKKKLIRYGLYALFFIILALVVSFCAIWIKYKIIDFEAASRTPNEREYSIYYNSLSYKDQLLYDAVVDSAEILAEESDVLSYSYDMEAFQRILQYIKADRADLFYVDFNQLVLYHSNHRTKVGMVYLEKADRIDEMREEYALAVDRAVVNLLPTMTDFEKEVAVNDYLSDNCSNALGGSSLFSSTAYGALVEGAAFCDGYAYATKQLLNEVDIDALVVYGTAENVEHVWNMVEIDGHFYHLDVMWNDADIKTDCILRFHGYFNLSDEEIKLDHSYKDEEDILPLATTSHNYYEEAGCYAALTGELEEVFYRQLSSAAQSGREYIELLCPETKDNEVINVPFTKALKRVNADYGYDLLHEAFSLYEASAQNNAVTIQIFYN